MVIHDEAHISKKVNDIFAWPIVCPLFKKWDRQKSKEVSNLSPAHTHVYIHCTHMSLKTNCTRTVSPVNFLVQSKLHNVLILKGYNLCHGILSSMSVYSVIINYNAFDSLFTSV